MSEQMTTAERIARLIFSAIQETRIGDETSISAPVGKHIAAEIDALTRERDIAKRDADILQRVNGELLRERNDAHLGLAEARALLRDAMAQTLAGNALALELAKAQAEIDAKDKRIAELTADRDGLVGVCARYETRSKEQFAEIETLRPAARAYNAQVAWEKRGGGTLEETKAAWIEYRDAVTRAREARS